MLINGAWHIDQFPDHMIIETTAGETKKVLLTPFRKLKDSDLTVYKGHHPRRMKGNPLPSYMYRFYGLEKSSESLTEVLRVRLSPSELEAVKAAADAEDLTVSEFTRNWTKTL